MKHILSIILFLFLALFLLNSCATTHASNSLIPVSLGPVERIGGDTLSQDTTSLKPPFQTDEKMDFWFVAFFWFYQDSRETLDTFLLERNNSGEKQTKIHIDEFDVRSWASLSPGVFTFKSEIFTKGSVENEK